MSYHPEGYMLEIDGVRAALSMAPRWIRMSMDSAADEYLLAIDRATDPADLPYPHSNFRASGVLTAVHFLRVHADMIMPVLQREEDTPGLTGVTEAYSSVLDQLESLVAPDVTKV